MDYKEIINYRRVAPRNVRTNKILPRSVTERDVVALSQFWRAECIGFFMLTILNGLSPFESECGIAKFVKLIFFFG